MPSLLPSTGCNWEHSYVLNMQYMEEAWLAQEISLSWAFLVV